MNEAHYDLVELNTKLKECIDDLRAFAENNVDRRIQKYKRLLEACVIIEELHQTDGMDDWTVNDWIKQVRERVFNPKNQ